jgi:hypothetical protein
MTMLRGNQDISVMVGLFLTTGHLAASRAVISGLPLSPSGPS